MSKYSEASRNLVCLCLVVLLSQPGWAWGNRGHRLVNLVAAETLPADMPAFLRTQEAIHEISYFGPEPDRWRPRTEPELTATSSSDHGFKLELGDLVGAYPRHRYDFLRLLATVQAPEGTGPLTPERVGTLPWQAIEVFDRLKSSFREYRLLKGEFLGKDFSEVEPMSAEDLPYVQHTILFYAGWLGHYIGDGSHPLHTTINSNNWVAKDNPKGFSRTKGAHVDLEQMSDRAIEGGLLREEMVRKYTTPPARLTDPFLDTIAYLRTSHEYVETTFSLDKSGALAGTGTPESIQFTAQRMGAGAAMLRDMIYSAWLESANLDAPPYPTK
jgi:hypothetical protein